MASAITHDELQAALLTREPPLIIDVRRQEAFLAATEVIQGALRRDPATADVWVDQLPRAASLVVYCAHGREVSQSVASALAQRGHAARYLAGGIAAGWRSRGGALDAKAAGTSSRWVTRARPKIDRIACPWLIARFVDPGAEFLYVSPAEVLAVAAQQQAIPYDVPDVAFSHVGELCSFDAFLAHYRLRDPALLELAANVRGADTDELDLEPQAAGLLAISLGLSRLFPDDHALLRHGMVIYDALYRWCKEGKDEVHTWNPDAYRASASV